MTDKKLINIRVLTSTWKAAYKKAIDNNTTLTKLITDFLTNYIK